MKKYRFLVILTTIFISIFWVGCSYLSTKTDLAQLNSGEAKRFIASEDLTKPWAYDPGPSPQDAMGKELIDLVATQPFMPGISKELTGDQKFRPAFGPTLWRMIQKPNTVKILFIGQDGTHIAEAAGRTATAGFGGRGQDMAAYFGVDTGAAFINTFAFTIRGQYASAQAPVISGEPGDKRVSFAGIVENGTWLMSQDLDSPMVKWRNSLIDWIIRNNRNSLKMVVLFGGSAQDSIGTFIRSKGGQVGTRYPENEIATRKIQIPLFSMENAGGNNEFPVIKDTSGRDLYSVLAKRQLNYSNADDQKIARNLLSTNLNKISNIALVNSGVGQSGVVDPAQIGGYDLSDIRINGKRTISLKGLTLSDGSTIPNDVLVAEFPHPTYLSISQMENPGSASKLIASSIEVLKPYVVDGWKIDADPGLENEFAAGKPYKYGRTDIGPAFYDFGTPKNRMVSVSSAYRMPGNANVVVIGSRDKANFDMQKIKGAASTNPVSEIPSEELFTARPRLPETRYVFDKGPGLEMAKIMKENIDMTVIGQAKPGVDPKISGIDAYNIKTHPIDVADFGHYRGTFVNPRVVILADPDGVDDILTSRALTGTRGQYLQDLMNQMNVGDQYLVIKTVPFGMDGASDQEWSTVLSQTNSYRKKIFEAILKNGQPELIIADGKYAAKELSSTLSDIQLRKVIINRNGTENNSGIVEAAKEISKIESFQNAQFAVGKAASIPRTHLGFMARVWEGTCGTRVFDAESPRDKGTTFAIVVPEWAYRQRPAQSVSEKNAVEKLKKKMEQTVPRKDEKINDFHKRINFGQIDKKPEENVEIMLAA
jgi:hypothetical protein